MTLYNSLGSLEKLYPRDGIMYQRPNSKSQEGFSRVYYSGWLSFCTTLSLSPSFLLAESNKGFQSKQILKSPCGLFVVRLIPSSNFPLSLYCIISILYYTYSEDCKHTHIPFSVVLKCRLIYIC